MSGAPDFVGVGFQGAGVSWWSRLLGRHPQIRMVAAGRPGAFEPFCARPMTAEDVAGYHDRFDRPGDALAGEWSPDHAFDFWSPPLLRRAAPEARLLALVRDPVERFRAGIAHQARTSPRRKAPLATTDAIERGRYGEQLERMLERFAPERLLVLQFERCLAEPAAEYERTVAFLGADPGHRPPALDTARPATPLGPEPHADLRAAIVDALAEDVVRLRRIAPDLDLSLWPDFAEAA